MSKYLWLLDAGHGGIDRDGRYTTAPSKMHTFDDGFTINEGEVNRYIVKNVYDTLISGGIDFNLIHDDVKDISLSARVNRVNRAVEKRRDAVLISIHCNGSPNPLKPGKGFEIIVYEHASEKSKTIAQEFSETFYTCFPKKILRREFSNVPYKKKNFKILRETKCPAILIECPFMDNREEAEYLLSNKGQIEIASWITSTIFKIEESKIISK